MRIVGLVTVLWAALAADPALAQPWEMVAVEYARSSNVRVSRLVRGAARSERVDMSWYFFALRQGERVVLVDTGTDRLVSRQRLRRRWSIVQAEPVVVALRRAGIEPSQVSDVLLTHAHWDHIGGLPHFPQALVHMSRKTHRALPRRVRRALPRERVQLFTHEHPPFDGVTMERVGSHTRGHSIVTVACQQGPRVIAGDVAYLRQNFEQLRPITQSTGAAANLRVLRRLMGSYAIHELIPGHDPRIFGDPVAHDAPLRTATLCSI